MLVTINLPFIAMFFIIIPPQNKCVSVCVQNSNGFCIANCSYSFASIVLKLCIYTTQNLLRATFSFNDLMLKTNRLKKDFF